MTEEPAPVTGTVTEVLANTTFRVELASGQAVVAYVTGKMRRNYAQIRRGDRVAVELGADDPGRGRIVNRYR